MKTRRALLLLLPALWLPLPSEGQTQLCLETALLDPPGELEASPRENRNAELLALRISNGLAADSGVYDVFAADLERIAVEHPDVADIPLYQNPAGDSLVLEFVDAAARDQAEAGENPDFNCLGELLGQASASVYGATWMNLRFDGIYRPEELVEAYGQLPGVGTAHEQGSVIFPNTGCSYRDASGKRTHFFEKLQFQHPLPAIRDRLVRVQVY